MIRLAVALLLMLLAVPTGHAREGGLSDVQAARLVPPGLSLGPRDTTVPAWPLLREGETAGYLFDTGDLVSEPVRL